MHSASAIGWLATTSTSSSRVPGTARQWNTTGWGCTSSRVTGSEASNCSTPGTAPAIEFSNGMTALSQVPAISASHAARKSL